MRFSVLIFGMTVCSSLGCALITSPPQDLVSVSQPKIYLDDQVLKTYSERRKALGELSKTVQGKELQEIRGVREASRNTVSIRGETTADPNVSAPEPPSNSDLQLPPAPASSDKLGLGFPELLRKAMQRDQLLTGQQLLYLGDKDVLSPDKRVFLLRLDVSINDYLDGSDFLGQTKFLPVYFEVVNKTPSTTARRFKSNDVRVYSLAPEYSSYVVQDSLVSSQIDSLTASAAGYTGNTAIQGAGQFQRALEEGLISFSERPLQFATYYEQSNKFAFSFGPRRFVEKRSWINPLRIIGHKYDIQYRIEPGPRDIYVLLVAPCGTTDLEVIGVAGNNSVSSGLSSTLKRLPQTLEPRQHIAPKETNSTDSGKGTRYNPPTRNGERTPLTLINTQQPSHGFTYKTFQKTIEIPAVSTCGSPTLSVPNEVQVDPPLIFPKLTNSLLVTSTHPISSETEVWINNIAIPREQISVLGRYQLRVVLPPNDSLKALLKLRPVGTAQLALSIPGITGSDSQNRTLTSNTLALSDSDSSEPKYALDPSSGVAGTDLKLSAENSSLDLTKASAVSVGGQKADIVVGQAKKDTLIIRIPKPISESLDHPVSIEVIFNDGNKPLYLLNRFTYLAPKPKLKD